jgi:hypothetical protein
VYFHPIAVLADGKNRRSRYFEPLAIDSLRDCADFGMSWMAAFAAMTSVGRLC